MNQIEKDMDVVNLVKVQQRLRTLERVLFNSKQRAIFSLSRFNYLSSESESSDTDPEEEKKVYDRAYEIARDKKKSGAIYYEDMKKAKYVDVFSIFT